jgi:hypothetical protein
MYEIYITCVYIYAVTASGMRVGLSVQSCTLYIRSAGFYPWYINITIKVLDTLHPPALYLKHTMDNVRTLQKTHYASATSPAGYCDLTIV